MYLFYLVFIIFKAIVSLSGQEVTAALSFWPPSWDSRQEGSAGWAPAVEAFPSCGPVLLLAKALPPTRQPE